LLIRSSRIVVTLIAAMRTCRAQLQNPAPAALYGWLRPMPSSR
jgi:hypothetical protein